MVGAKEAQIDLSLLCACATTVIGTRGTPLRMKFEFDFHVTGAPLRPSIQFVVAQPLSKLPLRVNSCFPRAGVRQAVQRVVHPFHMRKELPCPLSPLYSPFASPSLLCLSPLFWGEAIMSGCSKQCGFGSRALFRRVSHFPAFPFRRLNKR